MPRLSLVHFGEAKVWPCAPIRTAPDPKPLVPGGIALATVDPAKLWCQTLANSSNLPDTGGVIELTEPQVWTLIATFTSMLFALLATTSGYFVREVRSMRAELGAEIRGMNGSFEAQLGGLRSEMNARFERVDTQISGLQTEMNSKFTHLDRDVQAIVRHVFPERN